MATHGECQFTRPVRTCLKQTKLSLLNLRIESLEQLLLPLDGLGYNRRTIGLELFWEMGYWKAAKAYPCQESKWYEY